MSKNVTTTNITYQFDDMTGKMVGKTIVEIDGDPEQASDECEIENGIELDGVFGISPLETFLTAAAGALFGNLLYKIIHKD